MERIAEISKIVRLVKKEENVWMAKLEECQNDANGKNFNNCKNTINWKSMNAKYEKNCKNGQNDRHDKN